VMAFLVSFSLGGSAIAGESEPDWRLPAATGDVVGVVSLIRWTSSLTNSLGDRLGAGNIDILFAVS
jgi:hypothetical protein